MDLVGWSSALRYGVGVVYVATVLPSAAYWLVVHPLAPRLRRIGPTRTLLLLGPLMVLAWIGLFTLRRELLGADLGWNAPLAAGGLVLYATSIAIETRVRRHLAFRTLAGVPELAGESSHLLQEGIYGRVRHPRYLSAMVGLLGMALMLNYSGVYVMWLVFVLTLVGVIALEERELLARFGAEYEAYRARVPALIPGRGR